MLTRIDNRNTAIAPHEVACVLAVRNEALRLPYLLRYHRELGIARFFVIDNDSTDGTHELLASQPDVHLFHTVESYGASNYGTGWMAEALNAHLAGRWVLLIDADELFVFPDCETHSIEQLAAYLDRHHAEAMAAVMIDMYAEGPIARAQLAADQPFTEVCPWFDAQSYPLRDERDLPLYGGPRRRLFWPEAGPGDESPYLKKFPLIKWRCSRRLNNSTHDFAASRLADASGALLHFKLLADFHERAELEAARGEHWKGALEYRHYAAGLAKQGEVSAHYAGSVRYTGSSQLVQLGLMLRPPTYVLEAPPATTPARAPIPAAHKILFEQVFGGPYRPHRMASDMVYFCLREGGDGVPFIRLYNGPAVAAPSGVTGGFSIRLPDAVERAVSGRRITVMTVARAAVAANARFAAAYSTNDVGNSGWRWFDAGARWDYFHMQFDVPQMRKANGDFLGLLVTGPAEFAVDICKLEIAVVETAAAADQAGKQRAAGAGQSQATQAAEPSTVKRIARALPRFGRLPEFCGKTEAMGVDEVEEWRDYSARGTTQDQQRIEHMISERNIGAGGALLHVGIGNSMLAVRFGTHFRYMAGITLQPEEIAKAKALNIANYDPRQLNKFDAGLGRAFATRFDVIIDNNPASYACCLSHFAMMMRSYFDMLKPGGMMLTDAMGLEWVSSPNDKRWSLSVADWWQLAEIFGFERVDFDGQVAGVRRPA